MKSFIFSILLLFTHSSNAEIIASLNENPINFDESVTLVFTADSANNSNPDFSLISQNFDILNTSQSSSISYVNGVSTSTKTWTLDLMPKQQGQLTIPPINFGGEQSNSVVLTVQKAGQQSQSAAKDLFIEVSVDNLNPLVQQQVIYTLKIFHRHSFSQANITPINAEQTDSIHIEKLDDGLKKRSMLNGVEYSVEQYQYAIFPQKSGVIKLNPLVLTAEILLGGRQSRGFFGNFQNTKRKRVQSKPIVLTVRPAPATFNKNWLIAKEITIGETWSDNPETMKVGEPLTRIITLKSTGNRAEQLPKLLSDFADKNLKIYPNEPRLNSERSQQGLVSTREETIVYIAGKSGIYQLPELKIRWFNSQTQTIETAVLPLRVLTANGETAAVVVSPNDDEITKTTITGPISEVQFWQSIWFWLSLLFAITWLITLWFFIQKTKINLKTEDTPSEFPIKFNPKMLKVACQNNEAQSAKNELLQFGRINFQADNLTTIAQYCEGILADEIMKLTAYLYQKDAAENWQGDDLWRAFSDNLKQTKAKNTDDKTELVALHPLS